ncbi:hypothetical protein [Sulfurimonas sp. HSL3-7]|uniref:hypothetical protein n=1 Tax=Sulfonitrofixus jiaomeiensis TaxID=3131938 RepID=UPI0031F8CC2D
MITHSNLLAITLLLTSIFMSGCSQSDGYSTSKNETVEVIHGYTLPPAPDPAINNSTLLGIDSNNNGVRDDVEIWILKKYKDKHPIYTEIAMQAGRAWQKVLENPSKASETSKLLDAAQNCEFYFQFDAKRFGDSILVDEFILDRAYERIVLNTQERQVAYKNFDAFFSGGITTLPSISDEKGSCDFNVSKIMDLQKLGVR